MQKSKAKRKPKSSNWLIALLQGAKEDFRSLQVIHFVPFIVLLLLTFAWGQEEQRMLMARTTPVMYPLVAAINNGHFYLLLYFLLSLLTLGILFVRARRILLIISPIIIYGFLMGYILSAFSARMMTIDSITANNQRYYVSRFDSWLRVVPDRQFSADRQETNFIVVHRCDEVGIVCEAIFEDANTELSRHRPILEFEIHEDQLLLRRVDNVDKYRPIDSSTRVVVIEDNLEANR